jgi:hypothetical protein
MENGAEVTQSIGTPSSQADSRIESTVELASKLNTAADNSRAHEDTCSHSCTWAIRHKDLMVHTSQDMLHNAKRTEVRENEPRADVML